MFPWSKKPPAPSEPAAKPRSVFSTDLGALVRSPQAGYKPAAIVQSVPVIAGTMDEGFSLKDARHVESMPDAQFFWYQSQSFIGYQACAILAQNWLIDKACLMPARDAIRQGYDIEGPDEETIRRLKNLDKRYGINKTMTEFIHMGRIFGVRVAIFKVDSGDPDYYEKPFNIDGVMPGAYRGISQVDPIWCTPVLTDTSINDPSSIRFYDPQFWMINGKKYHRSHLAVFVPHPVPDLLKPNYQYGGISIPQLIYERVYAAERTANEAPQLAMTKRTSVLKVNAAAMFSNMTETMVKLQDWVGLRDNYGLKIVDKDSEDYMQHDTGLADLDVTIMTQYQLVAAVADVPATKLLGTAPKGFNATGEHEAENYRQSLESIQSNDLDPMLARHHQLVMKSDLGSDAPVSVTWAPLDSPTALEWADVALKKAQAAQVYAALGAIDGMDVREQLRMDKNSDYFGLPEVTEELPEEEPLTEPENDPTQTPAPQPEA